MEGLGITEQKLRDILRLFGSRCLIILDGLDEHALGTNEDVLSILREKKHLKSNIIVTSRPHIPREYERYFPTVVRVEGFTRNKAKQFASKILNDEKIIEAVLNYNPESVDKKEDKQFGSKILNDHEVRKAVLNYNPARGNKEEDFDSEEEDYDSEEEETRREEKYIPIPILLSFMCLLAREDEIDLSNSKMHTGEIYTRMVRCLYKKYVIRKGLSFDSDQFKADVTKIGKLALKTLLSGDPLLKRSDVIREIGEEAFDYGLLIGHEDFRLIRDETADIFVTFPHRSIQEFLGALYFIWMLDKGKTVQYLVGSDCVKPIFLTNLLFLQFCLWLLWDDQTYFNFEKRHTVYKCLVQFSLNLMNCRQLDMTPYPVFHISSADITWGKLFTTVEASGYI